MNTVLMNNVSGEHFSKIENQKQNCLGVFLDIYWYCLPAFQKNWSILYTQYQHSHTSVRCYFLLLKYENAHKFRLSFIKYCTYPWRRRWHTTPVLLPGKSHGRRSLVGCSPWGLEESDTTERLHFHFSLSCIGEGNGNPLQCSCLENPRDGGAWWAAVYGVAQSRTRLKWLNSNSNIHVMHLRLTIRSCRSLKNK